MLQIIANNLINEDSLIMPGLGTYYQAFSLTTTKLAIEQPIVFKYNNSPNLFNYKFIGLLKNILYFQNLKNEIPANSITSYEQITKILDDTKSFQIESVIGSNLFLRSYIINKESLKAFREISPFRYKSLNYVYSQKNNLLIILDCEKKKKEKELLNISSSSSSSLLTKTEEELLNKSSSSSSSSLLAPIDNLNQLSFNKKKIDLKIEIQDNNTYIITEFKESKIPTLKLNIKVENLRDFLKGYKGTSSPNLLIRFLQKSLIYGEFYIKMLIEKEMSKTIKELNILEIPYNKPMLRGRIINSEGIINKKMDAQIFCSNILDLYNHENEDNLQFFMYTNLLNVNDDNTLGLSDNINKSIILKIKSFVENRQNEEYSKDATKYLNFIENNNFYEANKLFHIKYENNYKNFHKMILRKIFLKQYEAHITKNNIVC